MKSKALDEIVKEAKSLQRKWSAFIASEEFNHIQEEYVSNRIIAVLIEINQFAEDFKEEKQK